MFRKDSDFKITCLLLIIGGLLTIPWLGFLEFFRHTEADRALIGWEMYQNGNYSVPMLLGDLYATKPPIFYLLEACSFFLFGGISEFSARFPSAILAAISLPLIYWLLRKSKIESNTALLIVAISTLNPSFLRFSTLSEIDFTFYFFCTLSFLYAHLTLNDESPFLNALLAWGFTALAFLTKGPQALLIAPVLALLGLSYLGSFRKSSISTFIKAHFLGAFLSLVIVFYWVLSLYYAIGSEQSVELFSREILGRFLGNAEAANRNRGHFYYLGVLILGFLPWSLALPFIYNRSIWQKNALGLLSRSALVILLLQVIVLSLSSGKAARYIFSSSFTIAPLVAMSLISLPRLSIIITAQFKALSYVLLLIAVILPFTLTELLNYDAVLLSSISIFFAFHCFNRKKDILKFPLLLFLAFSFARVPESLLFAELRNRKNSVRETAQTIREQIPSGENLYIIEMFERWIPFYLVEDGMLVFRLSPKRRQELIEEGRSIYILTNDSYEGFRTEELSRSGSTTISSLRTSKDSFSLLLAPPKSYAALNLQPLFPENPTKDSSSKMTDPYHSM